jgi:hypothetical protein
VILWEILCDLICLFVQHNQWVMSIEHVLQCLHCLSIESEIVPVGHAMVQGSVRIMDIELRLH